jgi:hypothetical protein
VIVRVGVGSRVCVLMTRVRLRLQKPFRIFFEFRQAVMAAEKISFSVVLILSRSRARLHFHAANWINHIFSLP